VFFPQVWDLIDKFKGCCKSKGWNACEYDDMIEAENEWHKFFWIRSLHTNTFRKVIMNSLCSMREGISYKTVRLSYMAWVLPEKPSESITRTVAEEPRFSRKIAIYDLRDVYAGRPLCLKLNETKSVVFQEFEKFLSIEYDIKIQPIYTLPPLPPEIGASQPEKLSLGN